MAKSSILESLKAYLAKLHWQKVLIETYPTKQSFIDESERRVNDGAQLLCDAARNGYTQGQTEGYAKGYADGAAEQLAKVKQVVREEIKRDVTEPKPAPKLLN